MKFNEVVKSISTALDLKRLCSQYVIDYRNLTKEELEEALIKTAPQYYHIPNLKNVIGETFYHKNRNVRILTNIIIKNILLNEENYMMPQRELNNEIIKYEQEIVNDSNEGYIKKLKFKESEIELFKFVVATAWENNDDISTDEKNLILKLKNKLGISDKEYQILEAELGRFPKNKNVIHTNDEINEVRRELQLMGLMFTVRIKNIDYDIIPEEMVKSYREIFDIEITKKGYEELIKFKFVNKKEYLIQIIKDSKIKFNDKANLNELQNIVLELIKPSILIGGYTRQSGVSVTNLSKWCGTCKLPISGSKIEMINRIISYYDSVQKSDEIKEDNRELYFNYFEELANRNFSTLRKQGVIKKDIECERNFEAATNFIFENYLNQKPLTMIGNEHPDGTLSYGENLILWDNKSKETKVNLKDHIKQFDRYILQSKKPVVSFVVIAPSFTQESIEECINYQLLNDTVITLITASELKTLAIKWKKKNDKTPFPLGYFKQPGKFNLNLVKNL